LKKHLIEAEILTGSASGQIVYIPRISMITNEHPFEFKRVQFPIKLCFAMSINKAQGQAMKVTGIDISDPCFTRGRFDVAYSRVSSEKNLYIYVPGEKIYNIVYKEILVNWLFFFFFFIRKLS
jgi:ATP-dependent DNA helicase PIF1